MPGVIDSHTHLHLLKAPLADVIADARRAGVTRMVTVGTDSESCREALAAAEAFPQVFAAVGRHPNQASGFGDGDLAELRAMAAHERCVAIGETGLDYYRSGATPDEQRHAFLAHIELARETGKPLVIHTRDADDDTLAVLDEHADGLRVILHCFSMGSRVQECLAHDDWWLSFAGNATYPKNADLMLAAVRTPAARLLVETDAPYLSPQPRRGTRNTPANVALTAQAIAAERRVEYGAFEDAVDGASAVVFGW
ncbi:MAG TPA: TatD family hydrolase [Solirubrobacteraceae bacterium]|jgi:TatD DNase family protein|nr:TatD family hydrolase [Solirubrobacteraceae bacterium]